VSAKFRAVNEIMIVEDVKGELPTQDEGSNMHRKVKWHRRQKTSNTPIAPFAEAMTPYKYNFSTITASNPNKDTDRTPCVSKSHLN